MNPIERMYAYGIGRESPVVVGFDGSRSGDGVMVTREGGRVTYSVLDESHAFGPTTVGRAEVIESRLAELEAELAELRRFGSDDYADGDVLTFKGDFGGAKTYSYAAIRGAGRWFVTGGRSPQSVTWDELVEFMRKANVRKVRKVTGTERVI